MAVKPRIRLHVRHGTPPGWNEPVLMWSASCSYGRWKFLRGNWYSFTVALAIERMLEHVENIELQQRSEG